MISNFANAYGGTLSFYLGNFAGDILTFARPQPFSLVQLICSSCNNGTGAIISQRFFNYAGGVQLFSFSLNELPGSGWFVDPKNNLVTTWSSPTQCQFINMLANLSYLRISGDLTTSYEIIGIDAISITAGPSNGMLFFGMLEKQPYQLNVTRTSIVKHKNVYSF